MGADYIGSINNIYHIRLEPTACLSRQADSLSEDKEFSKAGWRVSEENRLTIATSIAPVSVPTPNELIMFVQ